MISSDYLWKHSASIGNSDDKNVGTFWLWIDAFFLSGNFEASSALIISSNEHLVNHLFTNWPQLGKTQHVLTNCNNYQTIKSLFTYYTCNTRHTRPHIAYPSLHHKNVYQTMGWEKVINEFCYSFRMNEWSVRKE